MEATGAPEKMRENRDELTPMMEQYFELCDEYDDCLVLFQVGDFYETFCEAAKEVSRALDLTLTKREDSSGKYPMAGIPIDSSDSYIENLLDKGYRIAVADQVQDPDETTGVVDRAVTRIVTPGTVVEDELLKEEDNNYIACLVREGGGEEEEEGYAISFMDVSTGEFLVTHSGGKDSEEVIRDEIERFSPSEAIVGPRIEDSFFDADCMVTPYDEEAFGEENAHSLLSEYYNNPDVLLESDSEIKASGALLSYAEYTRGSEEEEGCLDYVNRLMRYDPREYMILDSVALRSLEIFESRRSGKGFTLADVIDETSCALGSRKLKKWLRHPLIDDDEINARLDAVEEWTRLTLPREEVRDLLKDVYDIERLITRVSRGRANARELLSLKQTLDIVPRVKEAMDGVESEKLVELYEALDELEEVRDLIGRAIQDDPPIEITEGGVIREGFDDELDELRATEREGKKWIAELEEDEQERTGIDSLKVGFNQVHGYYIEVTNPNLDKVPEDYTRRQTLKNSERFYTPELKEREDEILSAGERADKLEYKIFKDVRDQVAEESERVQEVADTLAELDVLASLGAVSSKNGYTRPEISHEIDGVNIVEGRHPVVERVEDSFVPNDAELDSDEPFAVITGPNMSGKSTYMRQVALISILAQVGCFVPAKEARLGVVDQVFTRVGASDEIASGRSTFMVEMVELANILHSATENSLILLDEVGRGTSTSDGLSIAWAVTEYIHDELGSMTLFATHYHELTRIADDLDGVFNLHVAAKEKDGDMVFLHDVVEGPSSDSYGIEVAEMAGVPSRVVRRARDVLEDAAEAEAVIASETSKEEIVDSGETEKNAVEKFENGKDRIENGNVELRENGKSSDKVEETEDHGVGDTEDHGDGRDDVGSEDLGEDGEESVQADLEGNIADIDDKEIGGGEDEDEERVDLSGEVEGEDGIKSEILERLEEVDTANITPVEALNELNELKKKLE